MVYPLSDERAGGRGGLRLRWSSFVSPYYTTKKSFSSRDYNRMVLTEHRAVRAFLMATDVMGICMVFGDEGRFFSTHGFF